MSEPHSWPRWIDRLCRFGFAAKGCVYLVVGALATLAAFGAGGRTTGSTGAVREIGRQPFGKVLLVILAVGLFAYVFWRFVQAVKDTEDKGTSAKGILVRVGFAISGLAYVSLALAALSIATGIGTGGNGDSEKEWTATLLAMPFGQVLVAVVGGIVISVGIAQFVQAYTANFMYKYNFSEMKPAVRDWARRLGRFGLAARGLTFLIIGGFLLIAAVRADPNETKGLSGALQTVSQQMYGLWLLAVVALGVVAYAVHCFLFARYRHFDLE